MLKRAKLALAVWGLVSFSSPAWAQLLPLPSLLPQSSDVSFCCNQITAGSDGQPVGRNCSASTLSPASVNLCPNVVFSCGAASFVQCEPSVSQKGQKDCSCSTFSN